MLEKCYLDKHMKKKHAQRQNLFSCDICDKQFRFQANYWEHMKTHSPDQCKFEEEERILRSKFSNKCKMPVVGVKRKNGGVTFERDKKSTVRC